MAKSNAPTPGDSAIASAGAPKSKATHVVVHPIRHDGKFYPRNSLIALEGAHAIRLEELRVANPIAPVAGVAADSKQQPEG